MKKRQGRASFESRKPKNIQSPKKNIILGVLFVMLFIGIIFGIMRLPGLRIYTVTTSGETELPKELLQNSISEFIQNKKKLRMTYMHFLTFPRKKMREHISEQFPQIENLKFVFINNTIIVSIHEYTPSMIVCQSTEQEYSNCFHATDAGYIFDRVFLESENTLPVYITHESLQNEMWIYHADNLPEIKRRLQSFSEMRLDITTLSMDQNTVDIHYHVTGIYNTDLKQPFIIRTSLRQSHDETTNLVRTTLENDDVKKRLDKGDILEYIDVRFSNKILYRFYGDI